MLTSTKLVRDARPSWEL